LALNRCYCDLLGLASTLVNRRHLEDVVDIHVKCDLDLWDSTRSWRDAGELELTQEVVAFRHAALSFEHEDCYLRLDVGGGRKDLRLSRW
jgi:hypothetical protein